MLVVLTARVPTAVFLAFVEVTCEGELPTAFPHLILFASVIAPCPSWHRLL